VFCIIFVENDFWWSPNIILFPIKLSNSNQKWVMEGNNEKMRYNSTTGEANLENC